MLPIIITVLAVIMLIGPVMMLRPSPLQKKQAALRQIASEQGLLVSGGQTLNNGIYVVNYVLPNKDANNSRVEWCLKRQKFAHEAHYLEDWDWLEAPKLSVFKNEKEVKDLLSAFSGDFYSVCVDRLGVSVGWSEKLNGNTVENAVESVREFLIKLEEQLV